MTGTDLELLVRQALMQAQEAAPAATDMFAGVVRRRRQRRRHAALVTVAAAAALAAVAIPVTAAISALGLHTTVSPSHNLHPKSLPIGEITGEWEFYGTIQASATADGSLFLIANDAPTQIVRLGNDGQRRLPLPATLALPGSPLMTATAKAVYLTFTNTESNGSPIWRIDPASFTITAQTTLTTQALRIASSNAGVYVMGGDDHVYSLDPTTLAVTHKYKALQKSDAGYSLGGMVRDGDGVDIIAVKSYGRQPWLQHLNATLQPAGNRMPLSTTADLNLIGSACGLSAVRFHYLNGKTTSTVNVTWPDPQGRPLTVQGSVDGLERNCPSNTTYLEVTSNYTPRIDRVDLTPGRAPEITWTWTPDPKLLVTGIELAGRDVWLLGPTTRRIRLPVNR